MSKSAPSPPTQNRPTRERRHNSSVFRQTPSLLCLSLMLGASLTLSACTLSREKGSNDSSKISALIESAEPFSASGTEAIPAKWWQSFDDPQLKHLVQTALQNNFSLASTWQRLEEARAAVRAETSALFPTLDANLSAETTAGDSQQPDRYRAGLEAAYEVDLWGGIQSRAEAERLRAEATYADIQTAALSLSAEAALAWYRLVETYQQQALLARQITTNEKILKLLKTRFENGQAPSADVLRQQQLLESTETEMTAAEESAGIYEHQLAVLLGTPPQSFSIPQPESEDKEDGNTTSEEKISQYALPSLPPLPKTGVPARLVQRRPDVQASFLRLKAADESTASAISNQYPRLTLSASISSTATDAGDLFSDWLSTLAGSLAAPLFDAGRRAAEVDRAEAIRQRRLYDYAQTVLTAFQEVENALLRERKQKERIERLATQLTLTEKTYRQLRTSYINGATDYLNVLQALTEEQKLRRDILRAKRKLIEERIGLYRALAGDISAAPEDLVPEEKVAAEGNSRLRSSSTR